MAQTATKPVRIITTKDGLPQSFVSGLVQDAAGFVWMGTRNGLARYDGKNFKLFLHSNTDSNSLSSNVIISLKQDRNQNIWIEHESGAIDRLDPVTETIERVTNRQRFRNHAIRIVRGGWLVDSVGTLWCTEGGNGLFRYGWKEDQSVLHYGGRKNGSAAGDTIRGLLEDHEKNVWALGQRTITKYSRPSSKTEIPLPNTLDFNIYKDSEVEIIALHERRNGELMFGDRQHLFFYTPASQKFRFINLPNISKLGIRWIQTAPDGNDYVEKDGIIYRYEDAANQLIPVADIANNTIRDIRSMLIDRSGLVWLGTNAAGVHQIDLGQPFFTATPNTVPFFVDVMQKEFGTALDKMVGWPANDKNYFSLSYFARSTYDANHRLWIALRDKVGYYDTSQKRFNLLPPIPDAVDASNLTLGIRGIDFSPDGTLWIIGHNGYVGYFDTAAQAWKTFLPKEVLQQISPVITLLDLKADNDHLWISTGSGDGLLSIDRSTKKVRQFNQKSYPKLLPTDLLLGLLGDPTRPELLWVGSYEGLTCLNKNTLKSEIFLTQNGLPDNTVYSMQADKAGYLWFGTNKGLCRFQPVTHQSTVFRTADGLPDDEFNRFHSMLLPNGHMAFGGTNGWAEFDPMAVKVDTFQPQVAFTDLKINNQPANFILGKKQFPVPLNGLQKLSLPYDQNTLTVDFAGLEFNQPQKLQYRYQLVGYDKNWVMAGNNPTANYTQLPPGRYTLKINASNTTGQWSHHTKEIEVIIEPPFWRTWWAYTIYIFIAFGLVWGYVYYRVNKERLQQQILQKEREAEQLKAVEEVKNRFFSNVTHEFRTPLTLIFGPAQRLKETLQKPEQHGWLASIERNAQQLLRLVNQLLDISKLEAGKLEVTETQANLNQFISGLILPFQQQAEANDIQFAFKTKLTDEDYWFDGEKLERIVGNLLANAIKFTPEGGDIEISLSTNKNEKTLTNGIMISVKDSGIGIPANQLGNIFNRFHQVDNAHAVGLKNRSAQGTGIGLSLVKELVDLQGGTIEVTSADGKSLPWKTIFNIWMPYLPAENIVTKEKTYAFKQASFKQSGPPAFFVEKEIQKPAATPILPVVSADLPTILLVEDNVDLANFIAESLPATYNIIKAVNGAEGLQQALLNVPELVISDVLMPIMDGYEFCKKLKADERTSHIPVIMLTAKASFDDKIEGLTGGADDYLTKPFHVEELRLRVSNLLERQNRLREWMRKTISQPNLLAAIPEMVAAADAPESLQNIFIKKLYAIVEEKLDENLFGVEEISAEMGMSRSSLHRKIKAITGLSTSEVVRNYRLNRAADFLKKGHNSSETAYMVGFDSPAYFSKCFHEFYHLTPSEFAQKAA